MRLHDECYMYLKYGEIMDYRLALIYKNELFFLKTDDMIEDLSHLIDMHDSVCSLTRTDVDRLDLRNDNNWIAIIVNDVYHVSSASEYYSYDYIHETNGTVLWDPGQNSTIARAGDTLYNVMNNVLESGGSVYFPVTRG